MYYAFMRTHDDLRRPGSLDRAYREHASRAFAAAMRVLRDPAAAEDVVQEVFMSLWRNPGQFDSARGTLLAYVSMLARSRALDRWRSQAAHDAAVEREARARESAPRESFASPGADEPTLDRERSREVMSALDALPDPQREALLLAFGRGLTAREIARANRIPLGTAKSRIRLGLEKARESLEAPA
jgi:RNA polymerase sigma-70 factor, ECF subfamily